MYKVLATFSKISQQNSLYYGPGPISWCGGLACSRVCDFREKGEIRGRRPHELFVKKEWTCRPNFQRQCNEDFKDLLVVQEINLATEPAKGTHSAKTTLKAGHNDYSPLNFRCLHL